MSNGELMELVNANIQAGARAVLRRAVFEVANIPAKNLREMHTDTLLALVKDWKAPVDKIAGWWEIIAEGRPKLSDRQRDIMRGAAARARELVGA